MRTSLLLSLFLMTNSVVFAAPNPFQETWKTPFGVPPFDRIRSEHFLPAFEEGMKRQKAEIAVITRNPAAPDFRNTIEALDASGQFLSRVTKVFYCLAGAETDDEIQAIQTKISPILAGHEDDINLDEALFRRVKAVYEKRDRLKLDEEQKTVLERFYRGFARGGATLSPEGKTRLRSINAELSSLSVKFSDNLLKETNGFKLIVEKRDDLAGLSDEQLLVAAETAKKAGLEGKWVFTLKTPSFLPFMENARNRPLRERLFKAYIARCDQGGATDNKAIASRMASLRAEKARLLGYKTWAHFILEENMAQEPGQVYKLLQDLWTPALKVVARDAAELQAKIDGEMGGFKLEPWDWRFVASQVRKARFDVDEAQVKPYFPLDQVREGAFAVAQRLYGIRFLERKDLPVYAKGLDEKHPEVKTFEVKTFEVKDKNGAFLGVFYCDYHPRSGKRGGAWCSRLQSQWRPKGRDVRPIMYNVGNFSRPAGDAPALLSHDEVRTLFHEFGHALHGLLSQRRYVRSEVISRDFVELPSQIMENWAFEPEVLKLYARHHKTGELIPDALVRKLNSAAKFDQGFNTVEYLAASFLDMDWHTLTETQPQDTTAFEKASLDKWGLVPQIVTRYRSPYFQHIFSGGYSSGYYGYIWAAVLDADAFQAFKEKGDLFDPATAKAFRELLSRGGAEAPMELYKRFRGREPKVEPLLERRGLK